MNWQPILAWLLLGSLLGVYGVVRFQRKRHYHAVTLWLVLLPLFLVRHAIAWPYMVLYVWPSDEYRKTIFGRLAR